MYENQYVANSRCRLSNEFDGQKFKPEIRKQTVLKWAPAQAGKDVELFTMQCLSRGKAKLCARARSLDILRDPLIGTTISIRLNQRPNKNSKISSSPQSGFSFDQMSSNSRLN